MQSGFCFLGAVSVRKEPTSLSEQVTQLLFGDTVEVLDEHTGANVHSDSWLYIRNIYDDYEGWADKRNILFFPDEESSLSNNTDDENNLQTDKGLKQTDESHLKEGLTEKYIVSSPIAKIRMDNDIITVPMASRLNDKIFTVNNHYFTLLEGSVIPTDKCSPLLIKAIALLYLNTPYQWGGKSIFGMDCSGFVQNVFSFAGIRLSRDASKQALQGKEVAFEQMQANDLMFFCNDSGKINHVGICLGEGKIIHCSGKVRIDDVSQQGIFTANDRNIPSHRLCKIMRITK